MNDNNTAFNSNKYDDSIIQTIPYYEDFYKQIIDVVKNYYNNISLKWLDVGCGTGKMAKIALSELKIEEFVFNDCSSKMIEIAKERFTDNTVKFITSPVQKLNYQNEFDIVTAIQVNHYFHKEERIISIKKCFNALKSNGLFISFENFKPFSKIGENLFLRRWKNYQLKQGKNIDECNKHISRYNNNYFPITISEHLQIMKQCKFNAVEIMWLSNMQVGILGIK